MRSYVKLLKKKMWMYKEKKKKKWNTRCFPHKFNAEEYFIIDLYEADVRLDPLLMVIVIRRIYPLLMQCYALISNSPSLKGRKGYRIKD